MPDQPHPAVARLLEVTPLVDGMAMDGEEDLEVSEGTYSIPHLVPPEPIAARQAVAVHREIAVWLRDEYGVTNRAAWAIDRRADEIEAQYRTEGGGKS